MFVLRVEFKPSGSGVSHHRILAIVLGPSEVGVYKNRGLAQIIGLWLTTGVPSHCGVLHIYKSNFIHELNLFSHIMKNI